MTTTSSSDERRNAIGKQLVRAAKNGRAQRSKRIVELLSGWPGLRRWVNAAMWAAAGNGQTAAMRLMLNYGADVRSLDDEAIRSAAYGGHSKTVEAVAAIIFAPDSWRGKGLPEILAEATALHENIKEGDIADDRLRAADTIIKSQALSCWERMGAA